MTVPTPDAVSFSGTPERADLLHAVRLLTLPSRFSMVVRALLAATIAVVYTTLIVTALLRPEGAAPDFLQIAARLFTLPVLLYLILRPFIEPTFTTRRLWEQRAYRQPVAGTLGGPGVTVHAQGGSRDIPWERVSRARADARLLALLTAEGELIILPRAFFSTEGDWRSVREMAAERTAANPVRR